MEEKENKGIERKVKGKKKEKGVSRRKEKSEGKGGK